MSTSGIRPEVQTGFAAAAAYDASRPTYEPEAVDTLLTSLEVKGFKRAKIADLGAGTGKFTELLAARPEEYEILAIEPHEAMREQLTKKGLPNVTVVEGTAASMPEVADGSLAGLVASQSFHWFANMDALKEIARVLQPTGVLAMVWNVEDYNAPKSWETRSTWEAAMKDVIWSFDDDQPRFRHEKWRQVFDEQAKSDPLRLQFIADPIFGLPLGETSVPFETWLPKENIWKRLRTLSQLVNLKGEELDRVRSRFDETIDSEETVKDSQGRIPVYGRTVIAWTSRIPGDTLRSGG